MAMSVTSCFQTAATTKRVGSGKARIGGVTKFGGNHIDYWDDTGFTADGTFVDGVLHHGGMILYRKE